jgi:hypothetical protein
LGGLQRPPLFLRNTELLRFAKRFLFVPHRSMLNSDSFHTDSVPGKINFCEYLARTIHAKAQSEESEQNFCPIIHC